MSRIACERHADQQPQALPFGLQQRLDGDVVRNVVSGGIRTPHRDKQPNQRDRGKAALGPKP